MTAIASDVNFVEDELSLSITVVTDLALSCFTVNVDACYLTGTQTEPPSTVSIKSSRDGSGIPIRYEVGRFPLTPTESLSR